MLFWFLPFFFFYFRDLYYPQKSLVLPNGVSELQEGKISPQNGEFHDAEGIWLKT